MIDQLVRTYSGIPIASVFASRIGTPIVLDDTSGNAYVLINGAVTLLNSVINAATYQSLTASRLTAQAPVALSGTTITIGSAIPSWVKEVRILFDSVSTSSNTDILVQLGTSGGFESSGYVAESAATVNAGASSVSTSTTGFIVLVSGASNSLSGIMTLITSSNNTWVESQALRMQTVTCLSGGGVKTLSDTLTQIQMTIVGGVNTFDAGSVTVLYQ